MYCDGASGLPANTRTPSVRDLITRLHADRTRSASRAGSRHSSSAAASRSASSRRGSSRARPRRVRRETTARSGRASTRRVPISLNPPEERTDALERRRTFAWRPVRGAVTRTGILIRKEVELATTEMSGKLKVAGTQAGIVAAGGALAHAGLLVLLAAIVIGLI